MKLIAAATIAVSLIASTAALAGPVTKPTAKKVVVAKQYCAVTSEEIGSMGANGGSSVYKGKKYLFCCGGCKPQFDKNPEKYVKTAKTAIPVAPVSKSVKAAAKRA